MYLCVLKIYFRNTFHVAVPKDSSQKALNTFWKFIPKYWFHNVLLIFRKFCFENLKTEISFQKILFQNLKYVIRKSLLQKVKESF